MVVTNPDIKGVDRPASARKLLIQFLNHRPVYNDGFKTIYDNPADPTHPVPPLDQVMYYTVWNACDHYEEKWLSPTYYLLNLEMSSDMSFSLMWSKETGSWRYIDGSDDWGHENVTLRLVAGWIDVSDQEEEEEE